MITTHQFGKSSRITKLTLENMPLILGGFTFNFLHSSPLFRATIVSSIIGCVVDNDTEDINLMSSVIASERIERIIEQWEADGCKKLRPDRDKNVTRGVIRSLRKYGFSGSAVDDDKVLILKIMGYASELELRQTMTNWVWPYSRNQVVGKVKRG